MALAGGLLVDLLTGLTHGLFDGQPWLVPYGLRFGAGRLAPLHEHRDTATICSFYNSELLVDQLPVTLVELGAIHAGCRLCGVAPDWFFLLLATAIGSCTQVIHKHSHLRGHVDGHYGDSKRPKARVDAVAKAIFFLQDLRILMPHETHRIHHAKGINPCLTSGGATAHQPARHQDDATTNPTRLDTDLRHPEWSRHWTPRRDVWRGRRRPQWAISVDGAARL